jgi:mannose-6-phosphate isomerase-like protein (cupin superfamily)
MKLIEKYSTKNSGYHPFLISGGWQVAQLNYSEEQEIGNLDKLDLHNETDEAFILIKGRAILIGAEFIGGSPEFEIQLLIPGTVYNVPKKTWHNIAMEEGSEVLIVEKSNTHISDFEFFPLTEQKRNEMEILVKSAFDASRSKSHPEETNKKRVSEIGK